MKRYETYKDSGIQWVGEIPSHWEIVKLRYTGTFENGLTYSTGDIVEDDGILVLRSSNIQNEHITFDDCVYVNSVPKELMVSKGDIIICSRNGSSALIGKCAIIEDDVKASFGAFMMRYRANINNKFAFYLFLSAVANYRGLFSTSTINQLTMSIINQMQVALPSDTEQKNIAAYLDRKVSQIDATIAENEQMLEDLKNYRSAIISEAVTKGLDKNVEMKDSGIEWMGRVPKHWNINKLKFFADISTGTTPSTDNEEYWKEPTENWYTPSDFCEENVHLETSSRKVSTAAFQESACRVFKKDVVLVVGIGATLGKIGISSVECSANQQINAIEFYDNVYPLFGAYYLSSLKEVMKSLASAATLAIMNQSVTGSIPFVCPTLDEQKEIADYLEKKTKSIGSLLNQIEVQIDELKSYKSVFITEAVTGKIDLRDWKPKEEKV